MFISFLRHFPSSRRSVSHRRRQSGRAFRIQRRGRSAGREHQSAEAAGWGTGCLRFSSAGVNPYGAVASKLYLCV